MSVTLIFHLINLSGHNSPSANALKALFIKFQYIGIERSVSLPDAKDNPSSYRRSKMDTKLKERTLLGSFGRLEMVMEGFIHWYWDIKKRNNKNIIRYKISYYYLFRRAC